jgi:hypothetical protein
VKQAGIAVVSGIGGGQQGIADEDRIGVCEKTQGSRRASNPQSNYEASWYEYV